MDCFVASLPCANASRLSQAMTVDIDSHSRDALRPRFASSFGPPEPRGRREDRVRAAPAVSRANAHSKNAHEHTGSAETLRPSPRNGFTAYFALSPVNGSFATVAAQDMSLPQLDASTAASGPHDFAVHVMCIRRAHTSRPPRPVPTFVTMANAPLVGQDGGSFSFDLPDAESGKFLRKGLDTIFCLICPTGRFVAAAASTSSLRGHCEPTGRREAPPAR